MKKKNSPDIRFSDRLAYNAKIVKKPLIRKKSKKKLLYSLIRQISTNLINIDEYEIFLNSFSSKAKEKKVM